MIQEKRNLISILKRIVDENPTSSCTIPAAQVILFIGVLEEDLNLVVYAIESGADPTYRMLSTQKVLLEGVGYNLNIKT
jgi:hypothetical protein